MRIWRRRRVPGRASGQRLRVPGAGEDAGGVVVGLDRSRCRVGDREGVLDVGQRTVVDPELRVDGPAVQHLEDDLQIRGIEEPEGPGIAREGPRPAHACMALEVFPCGLHLEPAAVQAERRRSGHAAGRAGTAEIRLPVTQQRTQGLGGVRRARPSPSWSWVFTPWQEVQTRISPGWKVSQ